MSIKNKYPKAINYWLWIGLFMVFIQVMIGGITRLTDSGLSITEWEVVKGTLPPLNEADWETEFQKYKTAAKTQFERLHADMTLEEFKWIYFWEWFHRLWARIMGFVFILPLLFFWWKGWLDRKIFKRLMLILLFAGGAGVMGWVMVASGLNDDSRTWVSAYKLIAHLIIAAFTFIAIYWTILWIKTDPGQIKRHTSFHWSILGLLVVISIQILWGGLMAGMRAAVMHPQWPFFLQADGFYAALQSGTSTPIDWINYEPSAYVKGIVQLGHRIFAYIAALWTIILSVQLYRYYYDFRIRRLSFWMITLVLFQFILGVITIMGSKGSVPLFWGVAHQLGAFVLLLVMLKAKYLIRPQ
jgi:cytochrome c oxidase assembly protein subunit 15